MFQTLLVTGGAGFIGSNFIHEALGRGFSVVNLDALTYAGNLENLAAIESHSNYTFVRGDIADPQIVSRAMAGMEVVINFAAESHVDRSIEQPHLFLRTNVLGTQVLLEQARQQGVRRFLQISTDEVYGSLEEDTDRSTEASALRPNSPYAASKAGADLLVRAYTKTYALPGIITRCSNNYGPYQFPEKLIPLIITNALEDKELPVYGDGSQVRDWIHVQDHVQALFTVLERGRPGEVYNIAGNCSWRNIDLVREILRRLGKSEALIRQVQDRPAHDQRYALDSTTIQAELGWKPALSFASGLAQTITWYQTHRLWWEQVKSGAYHDYYDKLYGGRPPFMG